MRDLLVQDRVALVANRVEEALRLKVTVDVWIHKCRVATKVALQPSPAVTPNDRFQYTSPVVGAVDIALAEKSLLDVSVLVEAEEGVIRAR